MASIYRTWMSEDLGSNRMTEQIDSRSLEMAMDEGEQNTKTDTAKYAEMISQLEKDGLYEIANRQLSQQKSRGLEVPYNSAVLDPFPIRKAQVSEYIEESVVAPFSEEAGLGLEFFDPMCSDVDLGKVTSNLKYSKVYHHINGGRGEVDHAVFSQDGQFFAAVHANKKDGAPEFFLTFNSTAKVFARTSGKPNVRTSNDHGRCPVGHVEFHPSEPFLLSSSGHTVKLHDHSRNAETAAFRTFVDHGPVSTFTTHPAGQHMVVCSDNALLKLVDLATFETFVNLTPSSHTPPSIQNWAMNDGLPAKASCAQFLEQQSTSQTTQHTELAGVQLPGLYCTPKHLSLTPIYNTEAAGLHSNVVNNLAFTPSGSMLASTSLDGSVKLWDTRSLDLIQTFESHHQGQSMSCLKMSPSGHYILTYGGDGIVNVTDTRMHKIALQCQGLVNCGRGRVELTSDGRYIVATDEVTRGVVFFHAETGTLAHNMKDLHKEPITGLAFNPLHDSFITTSMDNSYIYFSGNDHFDVFK